MGYSREIIVYQSPNLRRSQIFKLYTLLIKGDWTIKDIHCKNKICFSTNPEEGYQNLEPKSGKFIFEKILEKIELQNGWISFKLTNVELKRTATVFHQDNQYIFDLEIYRGDDEYEWFHKFNDKIIPHVKDDFYLSKIEWRNNYGNEIVRCETDFYHEGVLVLASSNQLKKFYSTNTFNYAFPKGIEELLKTNSIIAINASDLEFNTIIDLDNIITEESAIIAELEFSEKHDELLILNHADFTMICDENSGDYKKNVMKHIISIPIESHRKKSFKIWRETNGNTNRMIFKAKYLEKGLWKNELIRIENIPTHNKG